MPRGNNESRNRVFITFRAGLVVERTGQTEDREKARELCPQGSVIHEILDKSSNTYKKTVFERQNDFISGIITKLELHEGDFGWELRISLKDFEDNYLITIPAKSDYFRNFVMKAQNIKRADQQVKLEPLDFISKKTGKPVRAIRITQNGEKVDGYFTKDDRHGLPEFTQAPKDIPYEKWDEDLKDDYKSFASKRDRWLRNYCESVLAPIFAENDLPEPENKGNSHGSQPEGSQGTATSSGMGEELEDDDLPF